MEAEIKTTIERQKLLSELSKKENLTDIEKAELLADVHEWFYMIWKKLPDFSRKAHRYQIDGLENIIKSLGGTIRTKPEPEAKSDDDDK